MKTRIAYPALALCAMTWSGAAAAVQAMGPICDRDNTVVVHSMTYNCDGVTYHGALDISNGTCGTWNMQGMLVGSFYWNVVSGCGGSCGASQTCSNYAYVNGSNGYRFFQYHMNHSVSSYSRTCDRCALGLVGATGLPVGSSAHVHAQNNQYSTKLTSWTSGYSCGYPASCYHSVGYPRMS